MRKKLPVKEIEKSKTSRKTRDNKQHENKGRDRNKEPHGCFSYYEPLNKYMEELFELKKTNVI